MRSPPVGPKAASPTAMRRRSAGRRSDRPAVPSTGYNDIVLAPSSVAGNGSIWLGIISAGTNSAIFDSRRGCRPTAARRHVRRDHTAAGQAGRGVLRHAAERHGPADGRVHRRVDQWPDQLGLGLWRSGVRSAEQRDGGEPEPHVRGRRDLHGDPDRLEQRRIERAAGQDRLRDGDDHTAAGQAGRGVLRHAAERHGPADRRVHRRVDQWPDQLGLGLWRSGVRSAEQRDGGEPEPHVRGRRDLHGDPDRLEQRRIERAAGQDRLRDGDDHTATRRRGAGRRGRHRRLLADAGFQDRGAPGGDPRHGLRGGRPVLPRRDRCRVRELLWPDLGPREGPDAAGHREPRVQHERSGAVLRLLGGRGRRSVEGLLQLRHRGLARRGPQQQLLQGGRLRHGFGPGEVAQGRPRREQRRLHDRVLASRPVQLEPDQPRQRHAGAVAGPLRRRGGDHGRRPLSQLRALRAPDPGRRRGFGDAGSGSSSSAPAAPGSAGSRARSWPTARSTSARPTGS